MANVNLTKIDNRTSVSLTKGASQKSINDALISAELYKDQAYESATNSANSASSSSTSASAALAYKDSAQASATSASGSATTATTQAGIATTKANEASTSASNASISENNASTSAGNAATSESNAATSASAAASSALSASASADAALAALDSFDDRSGYARYHSNAYLNSSTTTADFISELTSEYGCFAGNMVVLKCAWSYAGNSDLVTGDAICGTIELAGCVIETWGDSGTKHVRITRPTTGTGGERVYVYNDQGSSYSPSWRMIWTSDTDGAGSGLDADTVDGLQASQFLRSDVSDIGIGGLILRKDNDPLFIQSATNAAGATIKFSDDSNYSQTGYITYKHSDGAIGIEPVTSNDGFVIGGSEANTLVDIEGYLNVSNNANIDGSLEVDGTSLLRGNVTASGDLTVNGGDIVLGGTGRIQGIDTVSASTDAVNKAYVDTAVAGAGGSTDTGAVGTYAYLMRPYNNASIVEGSDYSGSGLRYAGVNTSSASTGYYAFCSGSGGTPSGTWRAMGRCNARSDRMPSTLFIRIS